MDRRFRLVTVFVITALALISVSVWFIGPLVSRQHPSVNTGAKKSEVDDSYETNWPQFRGPTFDAVSPETNLVDSWSDDGPPLVWTRELGEGYSSFSAAGQYVFTQYQNLTQQLVVCLDAETGQTIWTHFYAWPYEGGGLYPGPRSTPAWHDGRIYFTAPDGTVSCLNADSGHPIWSVNPKKRFRGRGTDFGYACSPIVIEGKVILPVGGQDASVIALDATTGSLIWASGDSPASYATALPISLNGKRRVVVPLENSIAAFEIGSGKLFWEIELSQGYDEHSAAPMYSEPFLCFASPFQAGAKCYKLLDRSEGASAPDASLNSEAPRVASSELNPSDSNSSNSNDQPAITVRRQVSPDAPHANSQQPAQGLTQLVWESPRMSNDVCSSVLFEGRLYGFDLKDPQSRMNRPSRGAFRCLDFQTGKVIWSTDRVGQSTIVVADRKLILFTDRGELILARPGTDEYTELARTTVFKDEICWTSPAFHRGRIYLRTQTRAACLDLNKSPAHSPRPAGRIQDIPRGRLLDAAVLIGGEREFPATVPSRSEFAAWYIWSLASLGFASFTSIVVWVIGQSLRLVFRRWMIRRHLLRGDVGFATRSEDWSVVIARVAFWLVVVTAGTIGSPLINARQSEYVLLWPLVLWAVFQMTINVIVWTERQADRRWLRWLSRASVALFIGTCLLYFALCRGLGYAIEWSFLIGFLPAFIIAVWAGRWLTLRPRIWLATDAFFSTLSWTTYFWSSVLIITWKLAVGT